MANNSDTPELRPGQKEALAKLRTWYEDSDDHVFTLYGAAGTGKTFLLRKFLDEVVKYGIAVTAPTHKAVRVVEKATKRKGKTFQSLHGLRPNFNLESFNIDKIKFDTIGIEQIQNFQLVVVDECSQIGEELHDLNMTRAKTYGVKILYVGDLCQLPPIGDIGINDGQRFSVVFDLPNKFELLEIIRQKEDSPLLDVLGMLRNDVLNQSSTFINHINKHHFGVNSKDEGYACLNLTNFKSSVFDRFANGEYKNNPEYVKYTAWRNSNIGSWNKYLRTLLFKKPEDVLIQQDLLLGYNTVVDPNNYMEALITNTTDYNIRNIIRRRSDHGFEVFAVNLDDGKKEKTVFIVDHQHSTFKRFYNKVNLLHKAAIYAQPNKRGQAWRTYYEFKDSYLTLVDFKLRDKTEDGYSVRGTVKKDLDYGYGMTIHKMQGSTVDYVYVNLIDIAYYRGDKSYPIVNTRDNPYAIEYRNKLLYTAISRAAKKAILLI